MYTESNSKISKFKTISLGDFFRIFRDKIREDNMLLIGAGASVSSGIPAADELIWIWKHQIVNRKINCSFENVSAELQFELDQILKEMKKYVEKDVPDYYSKILSYRFETPGDEVKYFKDICSGKIPAVGYQILANFSRRNIFQYIFTTNFDNLICQSLEEKGIPIGTVSLANPSEIFSTAPKGTVRIVSLHGNHKDGSIKNRYEDLATLNLHFEECIKGKSLDHNFLVVGYGGKDKGLMDALRQAYDQELGKGSINGNLFWLSYNNELSPSTIELLNMVHERGRAVYHVAAGDFDEFMQRMEKEYLKEDTVGIPENLLSSEWKWSMK